MNTSSPTDAFDESDFRKRNRLKARQIEFVVLLMRELSVAWREQRSSRPLSALPEYNRFVLGAYACGFVCQDLPPRGPKSLGDDFADATARSGEIAKLPLQDIRQLVHFLIRRERWNIEMVDEQEGTIRGSLEWGLIDLIAHRLEALLQRTGC